MLKYLKDHILEEIEGALDYMEKAVTYKGTDWGCMFYKMSAMELDHANHLVKMFNATKKPSNVTDAEHAAMNKEILEAYSTSMGKVEAMKKLYWSE